jgi:hypothetical protein
MKKIVVLFIGLLFLFASCEKFLEEKPLDKVSSSVLEGTVEGTKASLTALYNLFRKAYNVQWDSKGTYWFYCADDLSVVRTWNDGEVYRNSMNPSGMSTNKWEWTYMLANRANNFINNTQVTMADYADLKKVISEAKVMRACGYFDLHRIYDKVVLDTLSTMTTFVPADKTALLKFIKSDLDYAIANLSFTVGKGVIGKGLALQLRAEVAMWEKDYTKAASCTQQIIDSKTFELQAVNAVFPTDVNTKEAIYTFQYNRLNGGSHDNAGGYGNNLKGMFTSRWYEIPGGYMIEDNAWNGRTLAWCLPNNYLKSLYDQQKDKRFLNYFYPDSIISNNPASAFFGKIVPKSALTGRTYRQYHWSLKKYQDLGNGTLPTDDISFKDLMFYRYAETLLLAAEAYMNLGNQPMACKYFNEVRHRAGFLPADDYTVLTLKDVLDENARELCFEGKRWFLLKRTEKLVEQVNLYHRWGGTAANEAASPMLPHMVNWPIPSAQITAMGGTFGQNDGYN